MSKCYPSPLPCELCPYGKACRVPEAQRTDCKMKSPENEEFVDWKADHPLFGMTKQELLSRQY